MKKFTLPEGSKTKVLNGHKFDEDGVLYANDDDADKMAPALVRFYGCKMETVQEEVVEETGTVGDDPSLAKENTQG